jgi:ABC-type sugar transport system ATPase subunit
MQMAARIGTKLPVLESTDIGKSYVGIVALRDVSFDVLPGEVHALVGENGAGKSTLVRILSGAESPDSGAVRVGGELVQLRSPAQARRLGIATIYQELSIVPWLSAAENIVLGREPSTAGLVRRASSERAARTALEKLDATIDVRLPAWRLSMAQRQLVEIARALRTDSQVLIFDEPTSSLGVHDVRRLMGIIKHLVADGVGVVFVSHRLDEVRAIADRVTVLRAGRKVFTGLAAETTKRDLITAMIGREVSELFPERTHQSGKVVLEVRGLTSMGVFQDISFDVRAGEVVGFAGLVGAGRTEVMRAIFGADHHTSGTIKVDGRVIRPTKPADAIRAGLAYIPEDRKELGLVPWLSGFENAGLASLRRFVRAGFLDGRRLRNAVRKIAESISFRGHLGAPAVSLSGGNQQKLVLTRWVLQDSHIVIFDEPTRGIDVGAKHDVYLLIKELAAKGTAVVLVSSETTELMNIADRIVVMREGRISSEFIRGQYDEREILHAALGEPIGGSIAVGGGES